MSNTGLDATSSMTMQSPPCGEIVPLLDFRVRINDRANFDILRKDIFEKKIYHFHAQNNAPRILDCGANIGMSTLYFKHIYPSAQVIAFEPDPEVLPFLENNITANGLTDIEVVQAALMPSTEEAIFCSDGRYEGALDRYATSAVADSARRCTVRCARLSDYLSEPIDFMKMNIEGAEWDVLNDAAEQLHQIQSMVIEYHHLPRLPRTLHKILTLLDRCGFEYLINDFDLATNPHVDPPFQLTPDSSYYLLVFAQRMDSAKHV